MRDFRDAKAMAQTLRQAMKTRSVSLSQAESLELVARILGCNDWNVLAARIKAASPAAAPKADIPPSTLPLVPLRDIVVFPQMLVHLFAGRASSMRAVERAMAADQQILLLTQRRATDDDPGPAALYEVGVIASLLQVLTLDDGTMKLAVKGLRRARVKRIHDGSCRTAEIDAISEQVGGGPEAAGLAQAALAQFEAYARINLKSPPQALMLLPALRQSPSWLADAIAPHLSIGLGERQALLETIDVVARLQAVLVIMASPPEAAQPLKPVATR